VLCTKVLFGTHVSIDGTALPVVESVRDLGITVSRDLSPSLHISDNVVAKARKRSAAIHRTFISRNVDLLVRAYLTYVRPLVEHITLLFGLHTQFTI